LPLTSGYRGPGHNRGPILAAAVLVSQDYGGHLRNTASAAFTHSQLIPTGDFSIRQVFVCTR
ncbi:Hypothetical predicted protein, partial [Pelobates cultripes]